MQTKLSTNAQAVFETVQHLGNHPTASEVYEAVRQSRPRIGMATVYRTLHQLAEMGLVLEIDHSAEGCRYDAHTGRHDHIICKSCGKLWDLSGEIPLQQILLQRLAQEQGIEMLSHEVRIYGLCETCRQATK
jgi:Fur family transcriptional regulator, peroxide stress response regulator